HREAARVWDGYRAAQPGGDAWLQATYWAGRAHLALGDSAGARARFREVRAREPVSYYSVRSAERLGEAFWPISLDPPPPDDAAARRRVEGWMSAVDVLRDAGLHEEAEAEAERLVERAGEKTPLLYPLAEALNDRGYTIRGVNIGYRLQRGVERPNPRLLRILYPFPYRRMIAAEAREKGLDPFLVAALTRQESVFKARISSPVGARGLMQVMPETGRALARGAEIRQWDADLLFNPEINVYLGTRYLAEQMREYDRSLPYVFSAYNAGPRRVTQWRRFPERRDPELFTERIPFAETRGYVKILTRNIALYEGLYGE
ncbi:MAG: lytic transglycosylase domain-containing protein, partial [Gemmatimonadota bacterium]|nr:lytic transglycosylase domain-containing protein [Gemmatimonadota bacterium]